MVHDAHRAEPLEQIEHLAILGQQQGTEADDALGARPLGEQVEQRGPDAAALPVVDHRDRELGHVRPLGGAHEARDADALARLGVERRERLVVMMVDVREVGDVVVGQDGHRGKEAPVARHRPEALEPRQQEGAIVGTRGADEHRGAVAQGDGNPGVGRDGHRS